MGNVPAADAQGSGFAPAAPRHKNWEWPHASVTPEKWSKYT